MLSVLAAFVANQDLYCARLLSLHNRGINQPTQVFHSGLQLIHVFRLEACTGMGIAGIPQNPRESRGTGGNPAGMETNVAGLPRGWNKIVRDCRGNVALFDSCGTHAAKYLFSNC